MERVRSRSAPTRTFPQLSVGARQLDAAAKDSSPASVVVRASATLRSAKGV